MGDKLEQSVEALRGELEGHRAENARLREELEAAYLRIAELEQAAARQAAPFRRPQQRKVPQQQKRGSP
jgi:septal ring factor EnvC (AmiA/AmiB activator)